MKVSDACFFKWFLYYIYVCEMYGFCKKKMNFKCPYKYQNLLSFHCYVSNLGPAPSYLSIFAINKIYINFMNLNPQHNWVNQRFKYSLPNSFCPFSYSELLFKSRQNLLDIRKIFIKADPNYTC